MPKNGNHPIKDRLSGHGKKKVGHNLDTTQTNPNLVMFEGTLLDAAIGS